MANTQLGAVVRHLRAAVRARDGAEESDGELLARFLARQDEAAFVALVRRHGAMVLGVARRVQPNEQDAEDVFQAAFLLLARKAGSIRKFESVVNWLHGVAHRLALQARHRGLRRRARERRVSDMRKQPRVSDRAWQELQATLDEALREIPENYRAALLACYLEGKTQEEAARHLGWPLGTVRSRLARGRDRLRAALARRGVGLSGLALATALPAAEASEVVPARLAAATARAAVEFAGGKAAAGLVSERAALLIEGGMKAMATAKVRAGIAVALVVGALGAAVDTVGRHVVAGPAVIAPEASPARPNAAGRGAAPKKAEPEPTRLSGRVYGPDGKPFPGARLLLAGEGDEPTEVGMSGDGGRFTVKAPARDAFECLLARAEGLGMDFVELSRVDRTRPVELRLVNDHPIRGRIADTQGKPVTGVRVSVHHVGVYDHNSLDSFLAEWKVRHFMAGLPGGARAVWQGLGSLGSTTTDGEGRFTIPSTGAERLVGLRLHGAAIADAELWVVNRPGFDPKPYNDATARNIPKDFERFSPRWLLYGPDLSVVAEAEKVIRGTVTERDTGRPRAGVEVLLTRVSSMQMVRPILTAKTDGQGRYEIRGVRKAPSYGLEVRADPKSGFLGTQVSLEDTPGYGAITGDIRVARGVVVTGRILDKATGKPLPGHAYVEAAIDNPFVKEFPGVNQSAWLTSSTTAADGTFRLVTIPGPVVVMGGVDQSRLPGGRLEALKFRPPVPDPKYPQYFRVFGDDAAVLLPGGAMTPIQGNTCKVVEIRREALVVVQNLELEQAPGRPIEIRDAGGQPLKAVWVTGLSPRSWAGPILVEKSTCSAYGVGEDGKPRALAFYEPTRNLFGSLRLNGREKDVLARLGAGGVLEGRLISADGKPLGGRVLDVRYKDRAAHDLYEHAHRTRRFTTGADGRFEVEGLIPDLPLELYYHPSKGDPFQQKKASRESLQVGSGQTLNLGDLRVKERSDDAP